MTLAQKSLLLLFVWPAAAVAMAIAWSQFRKPEREAALRRENARLAGYRDDLLVIAEGVGVVESTPIGDAVRAELEDFRRWEIEYLQRSEEAS